MKRQTSYGCVRVLAIKSIPNCDHFARRAQVGREDRLPSEGVVAEVSDLIEVVDRDAIVFGNALRNHADPVGIEFKAERRVGNVNTVAVAIVFTIERDSPPVVDARAVTSCRKPLTGGSHFLKQPRNNRLVDSR